MVLIGWIKVTLLEMTLNFIRYWGSDVILKFVGGNTEIITLTVIKTRSDVRAT